MFKNFSKFLPIIIFFSSLLFAEVSKSETNSSIFVKDKSIPTTYLNSRDELKDYMIDTGDSIYLEFFPAEELSGTFPVNEEGELLLPRIDETFVRGLTKSELKTLLEKKYSEFLIDPEIKVRITRFRSIEVRARGELRNPGFYNFSGYQSGSFQILDKDYNQFSKDQIINRSSQNLTTISDVIRKAGGITSKTDLSRVEIIRDAPLGKGGGKKRAVIDFNSYLNESDPTNNIRIFDGDSLFFPTLTTSNPKQIKKSILAGISPQFISVNLYGRIENPGVLKLPLEAVLSDAIDLSGPIKPLSGKIVLIRYEKDGQVIKKNINYSAESKRGSKRNPYLKQNDLISVKNSFFGKTTGFIKEFTAPFLGIYTTKELIEDF